MGLHAYLWYGYFTSEDSDGQQKAHGVEISFFRRAYNTGFTGTTIHKSDILLVFII